jgi:hypothetical protein
MDKLNIHRRKSLTDLLGNNVGGQVWDRFTIHYTPTHGSWLNQAEIELVSSPGNALGAEESLIWRPCVAKPTSGIAVSTAPAPKSTGSLAAKPPVTNSATKGNSLSGQRSSYDSFWEALIRSLASKQGPSCQYQ